MKNTGKWNYEPSSVYKGKYCIRDEENYIVSTKMSKADAVTIVDRINALEGLNPEALPELIEAARVVLERANMKFPHFEQGNGLADKKRLESALNKLTGKE